MTPQTNPSLCHWQCCKEKINLDRSIENSNVGKAFGITVVGYCDFHRNVLRKQRELFAKMDKTRHHSEIANDLWKNNRNKFMMVQNKAIQLVRASQ